MICAAVITPVSRSVCSCVFDEPVILKRAVLTHFRLVQKSTYKPCYVYDAYGPYLGTQLLTGFVCERIE